MHTTGSSILRRPKHFLQHRLSGVGPGHRRLEVALRDRVAGRPFCAPLDQLGKELPHPPQLILEEFQPFFYREFLFLNLLGDPHDCMEPGVRRVVVGVESGLFAFTVIANEPLSRCTRQ